MGGGLNTYATFIDPREGAKFPSCIGRGTARLRSRHFVLACLAFAIAAA